MANRPSAITTDIPVLQPLTVLTITAGAYYQTVPGVWNFQTTYLGVDYPIIVNLVEKSTIMGQEDAYYDIVCIPNASSVVVPIPYP